METITTKVLAYKKNGNDLKTITKTLTKVCENVYRTEFDNGFCDIYLKIGDTFVFEYNYLHNKRLHDEATIKRLKEVGENPIAYASQTNYPRLIHIEAFKIEGLDWQSLQEKRENRKREREDDMRKKEAQKKEAEMLKRQDEEKKLEQEKNNFLNGREINVEAFIELCKRNNVDLHIRTVGTLRERVLTVNTNGYRYQGKPYESKKLMNAVRELQQTLQA